YIIIVALLTIIFGYFPTLGIPVDARALDHDTAARLATRLGSGDLVISGEPEIFTNSGIHAMNAGFASQREDLLRAQFREYRKIWYYADIRTNFAGTTESSTDQWLKSHFRLNTIDSWDVRGFRVSLYEVNSL